jgi:hypothetical protein
MITKGLFHRNEAAFFLACWYNYFGESYASVKAGGRLNGFLKKISSLWRLYVSLSSKHQYNGH